MSEASTDSNRPTLLEPAIPDYLRKDRTQPLGAPADFKPVTPSFSARFAPSVKSLPMVFLGVQYKEHSDSVKRTITHLTKAFGAPNGAGFSDRARYIDEAGYATDLIVGYWTDRRTYDDWRGGFSENWWFDGVDREGAIGMFKECFTPSIEDTETTFSHQYPEGYSRLADHMSGETDTHGYWGSARDRIPRAQIDPLRPDGVPAAAAHSGTETFGRHIVVTPHENLCLLRSGQDWSETDDAERAFYLEKVEPFLAIGMKEIRDDGLSKGCFFNRYVTLADDGDLQKKTYSLSAWRSLADIEDWCKADTHLQIFRAGTEHYRTIGKDAKLRLYHEMSVIRAHDQSFEYFNCHPHTGMLRALQQNEQRSK